MSNATTRRRFIAITAAAMATGATAQPYRQWRGLALGAEATLSFAHPEAAALIPEAVAEIRRLEAVFSLYRADSALSRLNADGRLAAPPFELLECLGICDTIHAATGGAFDPTVQPLWALLAESAAAGRVAPPVEMARARARIGWQHLRFDSQAVGFERPDMALTLNGIAQGYIADRVAALLRARGLDDVLVNTGEFHALGGNWPVRLRRGSTVLPDPVMLGNRALASSAPLGTLIDEGRGIGHILDPRRGASAPARWTLVSISADSAAQADALSTAGCLLDRGELTASVARIDGARIEHLS